MTGLPPDPEFGPPSAKPNPPKEKTYTSASYIIELGNRLKRHSIDSVIGKTAKREVDMAGRILIKFGEEWEERKNAAT